MTPQSTLTRLPTGLHELKITGNFTHPHWMAFLFSGLAASGVSIMSGRAMQNGNGIWEARLSLDFTSVVVRPEGIDYVSLALQKPTQTDAKAPRLTKFQISRRIDRSLEVTLDGPDQIGFLGRVLGRMSLLMLFPIEIEITTVSGNIRDKVTVRGIGGAPPDESAKTSLETMLRVFVTAS
jgi:hypothetical protein